MRGDSINIEAHHRRVGGNIATFMEGILCEGEGRFCITIAGESGSGKSETAIALATALAEDGVKSVIFHQDDYFVHPPKTNDKTRRADINWVGPQEVHLDMMDDHIRAFLDGADSIDKPLVDYESDTIHSVTMNMGDARIAIAEGTYTSLLKTASYRLFIDRSHLQTRAHREQRNRGVSELDEFTEQVLEIEHRIISTHKTIADIIIEEDYSVTKAML